MKEIALFSVALLLGGCAYGIVDRSNEVRNAETLATCYVTVKLSAVAMWRYKVAIVLHSMLG